MKKIINENLEQLKQILNLEFEDTIKQINYLNQDQKFKIYEIVYYDFWSEELKFIKIGFKKADLNEIFQIKKGFKNINLKVDNLVGIDYNNNLHNLMVSF